MRTSTILIAGAMLFLACVSAAAMDQSKDQLREPGGVHQVDPAVAIPYTETRVHRVGKVQVGVSNWGVIGSPGGGLDACLPQRAPSFEYPKGSSINYLYQGALWIGAVKGGDTLVTVTADGWDNSREMYPAPYPVGAMVERTTRPVLRAPEGSLCSDVFSTPEAVSEQDFVAVYSDTLFDPYDRNYGGAHSPLGLEVTQESYAWSLAYADKFVIVNWKVGNVGTDTLRDVRLGLYVDADVWHPSSAGGLYDDDICGFVRSVPLIAGDSLSDTINLAWAADNDGDPRTGDLYDDRSPTGVLGVRLLGTPTGKGTASFNWWASDGNVYADWGPNLQNTKVVFVRGNLGTPEGDRAKYQMLGNAEFDYDQIETAFDQQIDGWLPPPSSGNLVIDIANGRDIRFLLGTEQFDLAPGESVPLTAALIAGPRFHVDPANFASYFDWRSPDGFKARLDFDGLVRNARLAGWVYDNPGRDTDDDGYRGQYVIDGHDTLYYTGDGVPDFRGPDAPPSPTLYFHTSPGRIVMRWNGREVEATRDAFSHMRDFEGYRVYISRSLVQHDFILVAQRDRIDFVRWEYDPIGTRWHIEQPPFTLDSLKAWYDSLAESQRGFPFVADSFADTSLGAALWEATVNPEDPAVLDTHYYAFAPVDRNDPIDDRAAYCADSAGLNVVRVIRKPYPFAGPLDTMWRDDGTAFLPYYEYEYAIDGLYPGDPVYMAVTAYDFGDSPSGVGSTEGEIYANAREVWPMASGFTADSARPKPGVYPNPYRIMDDYVGGGWERLNPFLPIPEESRQMTFYNLPDTCTISIWTLDGDLVRELRHRAGPGDPQAGFAVWDLINRNNDVITYGLYIYSVESRFGTDVGKLAIIR